MKLQNKFISPIKAVRQAQERKKLTFRLSFNAIYLPSNLDELVNRQQYLLLGSLKT